MRPELEAAIFQAKALLSQLESMGSSMDAQEEGQVVCPDCHTAHVEEVEHGFNELYRIHCVKCDKFFSEPKPARVQ